MALQSLYLEELIALGLETLRRCQFPEKDLQTWEHAQRQYYTSHPLRVPPSFTPPPSTVVDKCANGAKESQVAKYDSARITEPPVFGMVKSLIMLDISEPIGVDFQLSKDGSTLWVNVDGICRLRVCKIKPDTLTFHDGRKEKEKK